MPIYDLMAQGATCKCPVDMGVRHTQKRGGGGGGGGTYNELVVKTSWHAPQSRVVKIAVRAIVCAPQVFDTHTSETLGGANGLHSQMAQTQHLCS